MQAAKFIVRNTPSVIRKFQPSRGFAEAAAASDAKQLVLNFTTPHAPVYTKKVVESVTLPGNAGEYGVTANHTPLISELKPGVVTVNHGAGNSEKFFVPGGFALTHANSVTDVSVTEAIPLADFEESAVKAGHANAVKALGSAAEGSPAKAIAQIEIETYTAIARALGITLA